MFRNLNPSSAQQPLHLRRRQQARQEWTLPPPVHIDIPFTNFDDGYSGLDLSIHHPGVPSNNRFSTLAAPPPTFHRDREYVVSGHRRRSRNSRGTKEAKKRRDARRNRRKFAAQMLNEQLSRDIDETLTRARIPPPLSPMSLAAPAPMQPYVSTFRNPSFNVLPRCPPTPPRLPPLDFGGLDSSCIPYLATPSPSPPPLNVMPNLWCPNIPSRTQNGAWIGDLPKFFDLSHLPEPKELYSPNPKGQELKLWRPNPVPKKPSRFFPSPVTAKLTVKLPPTSCELHHSDQSSLESVNSSVPQLAGSFADALVRLIDLAATRDATNKPSTAANLWSILTGDNSTVERHQQMQSSRDDSEDGGVAIPVLDQSTLPAELDSTSIPYVHLDSLTGYTNERGTAFASERHHLRGSAICWRDAATQTSALTTPIYELSAFPLTPRGPMSDFLGSELFPLASHIADTNPLNKTTELDNSTAHFTSEQQLSEATKTPLPPSRPESPCDLASFLAMGHDENCWCRDCEKAPEIVGEETLTEEEGGWMVWSMTDDDTDLEIISSVTTPRPLTPAEIQDEDKLEIARRRGAVVSEWEDFLQGKSQPQPECEDVDQDFLGYYDDGLAFAREGEYDWMWNV